MNLKHVQALIKFNLKLNFSSPLSIFTTILMYPIIFNLTIQDLDKTIVIYVLLLFLLMQALISTIMYVPIQETNNRSTKMIKRLVTSPITKLEYIVGGMVAQYLISFLGAIVLIILAKQSFYASIIALFSFTVIYIAGYFFGFIIAQLVKDPQSAKAIGMIFFMFLLFGLNMPNAAIMKYFLYLLPINPLTSIDQSLLFNSEVGIWRNLALIFGYIYIYAKIGLEQFKWE